MSTAQLITLLRRYLQEKFRETFRSAAGQPPGKPEKTGPVVGWRMFEQLLLCTSFGLTLVSGIVLLVLISETKRVSNELKDLRKDVASAQFQLKSLDTNRMVKKNTSENIHNNGAIQVPERSEIVRSLRLTDSDISTVRQFIKTIPSGRSLQPSARVGDPVPPSITVPLPPALVDVLPSLAGAGFSIDDSGAILIIGKDTGKIVALIEPR